jgi:hypothetical protein
MFLIMANYAASDNRDTLGRKFSIGISQGQLYPMYVHGPNSHPNWPFIIVDNRPAKIYILVINENSE